jgi:hypothetical protein
MVSFTQAARSTQEDIDLALDAAHEAFSVLEHNFGDRT